MQFDYFKARFAYTVDGDYEGEVAYENFNAASASFEINGVNVDTADLQNSLHSSDPKKYDNSSSI